MANHHHQIFIYYSCLSFIYIFYFTYLAKSGIDALYRLQHWAARYNTGLLNKLMPKGVVFSFLFLQTAAAVRAHTDQHTSPGAASSGCDTEQHLQSAGLQSPGSSVSPSNPVLSLSVPTEANRKIFTGAVQRILLCLPVPWSGICTQVVLHAIFAANSAC